MSERVVERVRKLLALSRSSNRHEAEAAATKAQELVQKHRLEESVLAEEPPVELDSRDYSTHPQPWFRDLAYAVARAHFCRAVHTPRGPGTGGRSWVHVVGRREDAEVVREVLAWLRRELRRLAGRAYSEWLRRRLGRISEEHRGRTELMRPFAREWKDGFYGGAVAGIAERLDAQSRAFQTGARGRDLVRRSDDALDERVKELFAEVRPVSPQLAGSAEGWAAGVRAGREVDLREKKTLPGGGS